MTVQSKIAVIGRSGQLARALAAQAHVAGVQVALCGRPDLDITNLDSVGRFLVEARPAVVINAAAYTAVDKAESEPDEAFRVNAGGPALIATLCHHFRVPMIHVSTDYVFDGTSDRPFREDDPIAPLGVYGASKAAGETAVRSAIAKHIILRTSWVYSKAGRNFLLTMLRLSSEHDVVRVVGDQRGTPTLAEDLAAGILSIASQIVTNSTAEPWGTYHLTGGGETTWHGFAAEIFRKLKMRGAGVPVLEKITTADYPTPARRPSYSVLDNTKVATTFGIRLPQWQESLERVMREIELPLPNEVST